MSIDRPLDEDESLSFFKEDDQGRFYASGGRQQAVDELLYFCRYSGADTVMLLAAETGAGKTTILVELDRQLTEESFTRTWLTHSEIASQGVLDALLGHLDPEAALFEEADAELKRESIVDCCDEAAMAGLPLIVIVDDVEQLTIEQLEEQIGRAHV